MTMYFSHIGFGVLVGLALSAHALPVVSPHFYRNTPRCNCENNRKCNKNDGTCPGDKCASGYFGINCQHANVSLAMSKAPTNVPPTLLDGDDTTCEKQWNGSAIFEIDHLIHFIWVYIFAETAITVSPNLTLYDKLNKPNDQFYHLKLTDNSLLIKSQNDVMYKKLELYNLPNDTCSLEISIGRNLAIFSEAYPTINAPNAIDGIDKNADAVIFQKRKTNLIIRLDNKLAKINHMIIWSNLVHADGWEFDLTFYTGQGGTAGSSPSNQTDIHKIAGQDHLPVSEEKLVSQVSIIVWKANSSVVNIHEVYIYGEFNCPKDKYGEHCERHCPDGCARDACDPDWACAGGCKGNLNGDWCDHCLLRYGERCQYFCSDNCAGVGDCDKDTGTCIRGCKAGYLSANCSSTCLPGTYDVNCTKTCSKCKKNETTDEYSCDPTSGECLLGCADSFEGDDCETIIVEDDLISKTTGFFIAGLVLFILLLLYRSLTRVEEESSEEEEGQEADVLQKADDEPPIKEEVMVPSDDPKQVESEPKEEVQHLESTSDEEMTIEDSSSSSENTTIDRSSIASVNVTYFGLQPLPEGR